MLDLVIKNAHMLDGSTKDIGIKNGKINKIAKEIVEPSKKTIELKKEQYLSAGWIDAHVHCFEKMSLYYDYPDKIGVEKGVTSLVDAGTTGAENIADFYQLAKKVKSNVYALVNISKEEKASRKSDWLFFFLKTYAKNCKTKTHSMLRWIRTLFNCFKKDERKKYNKGRVQNLF